MNNQHTSALLLVLSFFVTPLLQAVSPQLSVRSQGQNNVHTVLQETKTHQASLPQPPAHNPTSTASDTVALVDPLSLVTIPREVIPVETAPLKTTPAIPVSVEKSTPATAVPVETVSVKTMPVETVPVETVPATAASVIAVLQPIIPVETRPATIAPVKTVPVKMRTRTKFLQKVPPFAQAPCCALVARTTPLPMQLSPSQHTTPLQKQRASVVETEAHDNKEPTAKPIAFEKIATAGTPHTLITHQTPQPLLPLQKHVSGTPLTTNIVKPQSTTEYQTTKTIPVKKHSLSVLPKKIVPKTITLKKRPNTPSTLIIPKNSTYKQSSTLQTSDTHQSKQTGNIQQKLLTPSDTPTPKKLNRFLSQKTQSLVVQKRESTLHKNPAQKTERFVQHASSASSEIYPPRGCAMHTNSIKKIEPCVPTPLQKCSAFLPVTKTSSLNKPTETAQPIPLIKNRYHYESAPFKKLVVHKNGALIKTVPLKSMSLKTVPLKTVPLKNMSLKTVPLKREPKNDPSPQETLSSPNSRTFTARQSLPSCPTEKFITYPAIDDTLHTNDDPSFARYPALEDLVEPASSAPSEIYPPIECAMHTTSIQKIKPCVPAPLQKCSAFLPVTKASSLNKPTETAQPIPLIKNKCHYESAPFKKLVAHKNGALIKTVPLKSMSLKTVPLKTEPLKTEPLKNMSLKTVPLKREPKNDPSPQETLSSPNSRTFTARQSLPSCPTEKFITYPAIDDTLHTNDDPSFARYPALEDLVEPASSAPSEIYPPIECAMHTTSIQKIKPCVPAPLQKCSAFLPVTKTSSLNKPAEAAQPIPLIKNRCQYESAPFKKLVVHKNDPLLKTVSLKSAPLKSVSLNNRNAAVEVSSVQSLENSAVIAGNFTLQPEIMRSFKPHALARSLFGCDLYDDTTIHIRGSALTHNAEKDWLADYFYLSNNYEGLVCFTPRVTSFLTDMSLFINLNSLFNGCFLRIQSPLTWTKWDLGMHEQIINSGDVTGAQGWRDTWTSVDNRLLSSFTDYATWEKAGASYIDGAGLVYPLYAAKMCPCGRTKTALADIHVDCGLYAHEGNRYHIGIFARGVMPTGTHPSGEFLFEPIVGNGHYWELGAGINNYAQLWTNAPHSKEVGLYIDCSLTHLFGSHQQRVFDLKGHGPLSRYILLTTSATAPASLTPAANITRAQITISVPLQADVVALINYANDVFSWNFGYNFWARSCEKIDCCGIISCGVCDQCSATTGLDGVTWMPYTDSTLKNLGTASLAPALSQDDLDLNASRTKGSSHKVFTSLNYSWTELDDTVVPFLGIGAEVEFGNTSAASSSNTCCSSVALSQWGLWLRTGTEF